MKLAGVVLVVAVGCGKHAGGAANGSGSATAVGSAAVGSAAVGSAAVGSAAVGGAAVGSTAVGSAAVASGSAAVAVGSAAASGAAVGSGVGSGSAVGSAAVGSAASLPPLGPPPKGMDATAAAGCDRGDAAACVAAARSFEPKGGYRVDLSQAEADRREAGTAKYGKRACDLGNGEGCALLAQFGNESGALQRACDLGYVASCGSISCGAIETDTTKKERVADAALCEKACRADTLDWRSGTSHHGAFCHDLYVGYRDKLKDKAKAAEILKLACAQGNKEDCPCKTDDDCGKMPEDEAGDLACYDGTCTLESPD
jgi:hypothetical protein